MKLLFTQRRTTLELQILIAFLFCASLMALDYQSRLGTVRYVTNTLVAPLQWTAHIPVVTGQWFSHRFATQRQLAATNAKLRHELFVLRTRQQKFATLVEENNRLRALMQGSSREDERVLVAELVAVSADPFKHHLILNKGKKHGVYEGQPVIDAFGVMGQVISVGAASSRVLLISDHSHAIPVQVNRNGMRGIVAGTGNLSQLSLLHIPNTTDLEVGDYLVTSGLGQRFPADYPVGEVMSIEQAPGQPFLNVVVAPSAKLDRSRQVLLVWMEDDMPLPADAETISTVGADDAAGETVAEEAAS